MLLLLITGLLLTAMTHHILRLYLRSAGIEGNICLLQLVPEHKHPSRCEPWHWLSGAIAV
jgi:hypothetical protein